MAPLIKATIQLLLGSSRISYPHHTAVDENPSCYRTHSNVPHVSTINGPSLSAISWGFSRMDVFGEDADSGSVSHKYWDGYQWGPSVKELEKLGGTVDGPPTALSRNASLMEYV